ncbi:hypothetical protein D9613_012678 [Agrocybe pediades]|uniref:Uncharacterized protein n=1 Tax=Agrocybe pediades TaxID=84607 RepID=A0A8H4VQ82_9AGAR|nr:hypothetical protein D9613_012678 [Agrocybe pediades]
MPPRKSNSQPLPTPTHPNVVANDPASSSLFTSRDSEHTTHAMTVAPAEQVTPPEQPKTHSDSPVPPTCMFGTTSGATGVLEQYGLFQLRVAARDTAKPWLCLILQDGGTDFSDRFTKITDKSDKNAVTHATKHKPSYETALKSLHDNGYLHNNLNGKHLVYNGTNKTRLISLASSIQTPGLPAAESSDKDEEMRELYDIIGHLEREEDRGEGTSGNGGANV